MLESAMQNELILELCCILLIDDLHYIFAFSLNSILTMCFQKVFFRAVVDAIVTVAAAFFYCGAVIPFIRFAVYLFSVFFAFMFLCYTDQTGNYFIHSHTITDFRAVFERKISVTNQCTDTHSHTHAHKHR